MIDKKTLAKASNLNALKINYKNEVNNLEVVLGRNLDILKNKNYLIIFVLDTNTTSKLIIDNESNFKINNLSK